jgi:23S rRNA pseudouridine2604 synthase
VYTLVRLLRISNKEALELILSHQVRVNESLVTEDVFINDEDGISTNGKLIREKKEYFYIAFYKPRGIETTLNPEIECNMGKVFTFPEKYSYAGRLDKESEGLLLLTNDGKTIHKIANSKFHKEKEYVVKVKKAITSDFLNSLRNGVEILGKLTRPATVLCINDFTFGIILTEGMNRQIRRMCYKNNYPVESLTRTRIMNIELHDLHPGEYRHLNEEEKTELFGQLDNTLQPILNI